MKPSKRRLVLALTEALVPSRDYPGPSVVADRWWQRVPVSYRVSPWRVRLCCSIPDLQSGFGLAGPSRASESPRIAQVTVVGASVGQ